MFLCLQSNYSTPTHSKVQQYESHEIDLDILSEESFQILGKRPFRWQLTAAQAILSGKDVVLDVGTGCGKSLCFALPLLHSKTDISVTISPLTALMMDQVSTSALSTVAVCQETVGRISKEHLYNEIANGKFQQVLVSPEIATSSEFHKAVWSKSQFTDNLRAVNIDEAHCINIWGGSFRPDYANLGILRGRLPNNVPIMAASATLPEHVLNDVRSKLRLSKDAKMIRLTNSRPNIALSVRAMAHTDVSKADLRFLIPLGATNISDVPITLVYCNQRTTAEDCADRMRDWAQEQGLPRDCIAFYHALIGDKRKREIEQKLAAGEICILFCTEALGMGCDLRNIARVIIWGLPQTFCALVQRAGRAGRDLTTDAEAITIVPPGVAKGELTEEDVAEAVGIAAAESEALARPVDDVEITSAFEVLDEQGIRITGIDVSEDEDEEHTPSASAQTTAKRRKAFGKDTNIKETNTLRMFVLTKGCRRIPWDKFFENDKKLPLIYPDTTLYQPRPNARCCDNCQPDKFPVEKIIVTKTPGLKRGKKKQTMPEEEQMYVRNKLKKWRDTTLMQKVFGGITSLSSATILADDIIDRIAFCGERIDSYKELRRHARWGYGHEESSNTPSEWGKLLLAQLEGIYEVLDDIHSAKRLRERQEAEEQEYLDNSTSTFDIRTAVFYDEEAPPEQEGNYGALLFHNTSAEDLGTLP